jgi:hypothetical protein
VAADDTAREAEKKAKEQEALNDAYQSFKQADQQSMQEYEAYQESLREANELKTEQQYIDYFASVNIDVAPGQLTLEQLRDMKAKYEDLHANSERDLSAIPEPDLLSEATPIPLGKTSSGKPAQHNSDTGWGKTLNRVDNHQVLTSIGIGAAAGISVAAILVTTGTATPLVAVAWIGGTALATGAGIAGGTAALNSYFNRDWKLGILRNALIGAGTALITGGFSYHIATFFLLKPESIDKITFGTDSETVRHLLNINLKPIGNQRKSIFKVLEVSFQIFLM